MPKKTELTSFQKAKIVTLRDANYSFGEISKKLGINRSTAYRIYKKFKETGTVENKKRKGRPSKLSKKIARAIEKKIKENPTITSDELKRSLRNKTTVSASSIRRYRKRLGFSASKGKGFDLLSEKHKKQRLLYCKKHRNDKFSNVLFTDEKPFELFKIRRKVWRKKGDPVVKKRKTKYPPKLQIWAGISKLGKTEVIFWKARGNAKQYQQRIEGPLKQFKKKLKGKPFRFQQDKDTTHTAKSTHEWLDRNFPSWFETPSKSPDLNPIEMIWNTLEARVMKHEPQSVADLEKLIKKEWNRIDQTLINKTIDHMIKLIPKIEKVNGNYVE